MKFLLAAAATAAAAHSTTARCTPELGCVAAVRFRAPLD